MLVICASWMEGHPASWSFPGRALRPERNQQKWNPVCVRSRSKLKERMIWL
ncbi:MAG: hypothetical protein JWP25_8, partial [Bradyrhizobium sp.]|nr:hypothetical protein [Bradyrhizobium sp.]